MNNRAPICQEHLRMSGTLVPSAWRSVAGMNTRTSTIDNLITNLKMLIEVTKISYGDLAKKSQVSERHIKYILRGERTPSIEIADQLASAFGLTGWQLIMPSLPYDLARNGRLEKLIEHVTHSSNESRDYILRVAEKEAKYGNE